FGSTIIKGNEMTSYKVFQNAIKHKRGDPYDYSLLLSESTILNKTGLFKSVNIKVVERPEHVMDVVFEIEEANRWVLEAGFGYAEYVGFRGFVDLGFKNIFGGNRQVRLRAEGNELSQIYSISYLEPWFLPEISFKTLVSYTHLNDENIDTGKTLYLMDKYTATSGVEHPISKTLKVTFYYEIAQVETYDVQPAAILSKEDTGTLLISSVLPSIIYDSRDNPFDPRKGTYSGMTLKFASKMLLSETDFVKISGY
ncbi:MAG: BamA/TamA family outer membrane protein, partial [Nitrospirae bacterium]|nr:BamA/TamA family outer membrane protein [Nitrospirota bacterium]